MNRVLLILVDGMRPDGITAAGHPFTEELFSHVYTWQAQTVTPSVTLPCHMSLFHSAVPERHGILTNTYVPQVRPIRGLCEVLRACGQKCAFFYNWEELKDLSRSDSLAYATFISGHQYDFETTNLRLTDAAISYICQDLPEFTFLYLGWTDEAGHAEGWMGEEYLRSIRGSFDCIEKCIRSIPEDYTVIVTADHGGHGRSHGTEMPEDMTIPLAIYRNDLEKRELEGARIIDIAPTVAGLLGAAPDRDWEGKDLLK